MYVWASPSSLVKLGTGSITYISGPVPSEADIPAGLSAYYTWVYVAAGAGSVAFNGNASGYDAPTGITITSSPSDSNYTNIDSCFTATFTPAITLTGSITRTMTPEGTETAALSFTETLTATQTITQTGIYSYTATLTITETIDLSPTITATRTITRTPGPCLCTKNFGKTTIGSLAYDYSGTFNSNIHKIPEDGYAQSIAVYIAATTGGQVRVALYTDDPGGYPGVLLAESFPYTVSTGWNLDRSADGAGCSGCT